MRAVTFNLYVPDVGVALSFFSSLEIFKVADWSSSAARQGQVSLQGNDMAFHLAVLEPHTLAQKVMMGRQAPEQYPVLAFQVDNLPEWRSRMVEKGVEVSEIKCIPPISCVHVTDPFGNTYRIES